MFINVTASNTVTNAF